jgi:hypothetical protein
MQTVKCGVRSAYMYTRRLWLINSYLDGLKVKPRRAVMLGAFQTI